MGQMYMHKFAYRDGVAKAEFDEAWSQAFKAFARTGNWGGVEEGVTNHQTYGTGGRLRPHRSGRSRGVRALPAVLQHDLRVRGQHHL